MMLPTLCTRFLKLGFGSSLGVERTDGGGEIPSRGAAAAQVIQGALSVPERAER